MTVYKWKGFSIRLHPDIQPIGRAELSGEGENV